MVMDVSTGAVLLYWFGRQARLGLSGKRKSPTLERRGSRPDSKLPASRRVREGESECLCGRLVKESSDDLGRPSCAVGWRRRPARVDIQPESAADFRFRNRGVSAACRSRRASWQSWSCARSMRYTWGGMPG